MNTTFGRTLQIVSLISLIFTSALANSMEAGITCEQGLCVPAGAAFSEFSANAAVQKIPINVFGKSDTREFVPRDAEPVAQILSTYVSRQSEVEELSVEGKASVAFISPCFVATNHHAVFNGEKNVPTARGKGFEVTIPVGNPAVPVKGNVEFYGDYKGKGINDWAVVKLNPGKGKPCPGAKLGWYPIAELSNSEIENQDVASASFSKDTDSRRITVQKKCRTYESSVETGRIFTDCPSRKQSSGGAITIALGDYKVPHLLALITNQLNGTDGLIEKYESKYATVGISVQQFWSNPELRRAVEKDQGTVTKNPYVEKFLPKLTEQTGI